MNKTMRIEEVLGLVRDKTIDAQEGMRRIKKIKNESIKQSDYGVLQVEETLFNILAKVLGMDIADIQLDLSFKEMGVDSISSVEIVRDLNTIYKINMDGIQLYDYPTVEELTGSILEELGKIDNFIGKDKTRKRLNHRYEYMNDIIDKYSSDTVETKELNEINVLKSTKHIKAEKKKEISNKQYNSKEKLSLKPKLKSALKPLGVNIADREVKSNHISLKDLSKKKNIEKTDQKFLRQENIAIIGMSGRFPGANDTEEFWKNISNGVCSIKEFPISRFDIGACYSDDIESNNTTYCKVGGMLSNIDEFDSLFFNISPKEAKMIDPQQRIFLEEAWKAIEDAGYSDKKIKAKKCGVFVGCAPSEYSINLANNNVDVMSEAFIGTSTSILASRISYFLDLKGPSMSIDTACSSSLVAIHQACLSIWNGESELALAGGIRLILSPNVVIQSSQMQILSPTGVCRPFDQKADGTILGEGVAVIILKPLSEAQKDKDYIYGVIKGSGVNQDGKTNGITAPSVKSQTQLEKDVYNKFGINPSDIGYIETHGTGTKLGDPIEVKGLMESFKDFTDKKNYCALGSIKANIGHTTMAAGVVSVVKILLAMKYKKIPMLLNYSSINDKIPLASSPFYINESTIHWPENTKKSRMAGISGFGFSGTNCHLVIEEYKNRTSFVDDVKGGEYRHEGI